MRTTIELSDQHRAKLLELAAERGEKGFSRIVQEAVERYLVEQGSRRDRVQAALKLRGSLGKGAADAAAEHAARVRRDLEDHGQGIGTADYLIAGVCLVHGATLLTGNLKHFRRVPGLKLGMGLP